MKLKFFLWTKLLENLLLAKYLISVAATLIIPGPQKPGGLEGGLQPSQIFAKIDLLPIENNSEKKKVTKKYKPLQISRKLLVTLLWLTSCNP